MLTRLAPALTVEAEVGEVVGLVEEEDGEDTNCFLITYLRHA